MTLSFRKVAGYSLESEGTLVLSGNNTYSGGTTVSAGVLQVTGRLANNGSNKVFVAKDGDGIFGNGVGDAAIVRRVLASGNYGGLGSAITNLAPGELPTTADILDGAASAQADVGMSWRTRAVAEKTLAGGELVSEVLDLTGVAPSGNGMHDGSHQTDMFVLQMNYDGDELSSISGGSEAQIIASGGLRLGYLDLGPDSLPGTADDQWINAVDGNFGGTPNFVGDQPYDPGYFVLGDYGVDTANHVVWAVVDHNSEFGSTAAVVPEPSTLVLLGVDAIVLADWMRRRSMPGGWPAMNRNEFEI
jgi:autotransporter-associated beta strand protein